MEANRGFATGIGSASSRAAGLPSRVLTQAEIRYPHPDRPRQRAPGLPIFDTAGTLLSGAAPFGVALANLVEQGCQP